MFIKCKSTSCRGIINLENVTEFYKKGKRIIFVMDEDFSSWDFDLDEEVDSVLESIYKLIDVVEVGPKEEKKVEDMGQFIPKTIKRIMEYTVFDSSYTNIPKYTLPRIGDLAICGIFVGDFHVLRIEAGEPTHLGKFKEQKDAITFAQTICGRENNS